MSQAAVLNFASHRTRRYESYADEFTFNDIEELTAFLAGEIVTSRRRYKDIAEQAGVGAQTVSHVAHGLSRFPRAATLFKILVALGYEIVVRR
jgi:transcriptional regulator with XRE-family HTH domain